MMFDVDNEVAVADGLLSTMRELQKEAKMEKKVRRALPSGSGIKARWQLMHKWSECWKRIER